MNIWNRLPLWGKFLIVIGLALAGYLGWKALQSGQGALPSIGGVAGAPGSSGSGAGGSNSVFPAVNGVPLLPAGLHPLFDSQGNLIGWQSNGPSSQGGSVGGGGSGGSGSSGKNPVKQPPPPTKPPAGGSPGKPVTTPKNKTYTVVSGDTLSGIASRYHLPNWQELYNKNKAVIGGNPNLIKPGQVLQL